MSWLNLNSEPETCHKRALSSVGSFDARTENANAETNIRIERWTTLHVAPCNNIRCQNTGPRRVHTHVFTDAEALRDLRLVLKAC